MMPQLKRKNTGTMKARLRLEGWLLLYRNSEAKTKLRVGSSTKWGSKWVEGSLTIIFSGTLGIVASILFTTRVIFADGGAPFNSKRLSFYVLGRNMDSVFSLLGV